MQKKEILIWLLAALIVSGIISWYASSWPDGLERIAADKGFLHRGEIEPALRAPFADYVVPKIPSQRLATSLAGIFGTLLVFAITYPVARRIKNRRA